MALALGAVALLPWLDAHRRLEQFVFHSTVYTSEDLPRGLEPSDVDEFVRTHVDAETGLTPLEQVEKLVDIYDVHEACAHLRGLLGRAEKDAPHVRRSLVLARTLAKAGRDDDRAFAAAYGAHLAAHPATLPPASQGPATVSASADALPKELITLLAALGPGADPAPIRALLDARLAALAPSRTAGDDAARRESLTLEDLRSITLERAAKATALEARLLAIADRDRRLDEEVKAYLEVEHGYLEHIVPWAARRLRCEAWAAAPADQLARADDPARRAEVTAALRRALAGIDGLPHTSPEERLHKRARALDAVRWLGGDVTDEERAFLLSRRGRRNLLSPD